VGNRGDFEDELIVLGTDVAPYSPKGPSNSRMSVRKRPSIAISAAAGISRSTVSAGTSSSGAPLIAPATAYSGVSSLLTLASDRAGGGERIRTASSGWPSLRALSQWPRPSWPESIRQPSRSAALSITR